VTESPQRLAAERSGGVGPYVFVREMGRGGGGVVWLCRDPARGVDAAVKVAAETSHRQRTIFRREIAMLSRLATTNHPGIVRLIQSGNDAGRLWYAMEYVRGISLLDVMRAGARSSLSPDGLTHPVTAPVNLDDLPPPVGSNRQPESARAGPAPFESPPWTLPDPETLLWIVAQIAGTLAFLHREGIVHGDLSPANVLIREDFSPVLIDFGLAFQSAGGGSGREVAQEQTRPLGTPGFMAPEQIRGELLDARCDLYALGCILHGLVLGRPPFEADTTPALLAQHLQRPLRLLTPTAGPPVEPVLAELIAALLEKVPQRRLGHAGEVVGRLRRIYRGNRPLPEVGATGGLYRSPSVGRDRVLERVSTLLRGLRPGGQGQRLILVGESGAGKTRMLNEAAALAQELDVDVVSGRCGTVAAEDLRLGAPPLHGFAAFLQRYADRAASDRRLIDGMRGTLTLLAAYEPTVAALGIAEDEPVGPLTPEMGFAVVLKALAVALARYARDQPVLVLLDDLQWADELTLSFWTLAERYLPADAPVSFIASSRSNEGNTRLTEWMDHHSHEVVELSRLQPSEIRTVAREMLGTNLLPARLTEVLEQRSGGNPFFVAEYLRAFVERGWLRWSSESWTFLDTDRQASAFVPSSLEALFEGRFEGLQPEARTLLQLAAILGREFDRDLLANVLEPMAFSAERADIALDELVGRHILDRIAGDRYQFAHDQLRDAVLRPMSPKELVAMNRHAASCFEASRGVLPNITAERLGVHLANAGQAAEALPYLQEAAAEADAVYAISRAIELYRLALAQAERIEAAPHGPEAAAPRLAEALADVLARSARHDDARALYRRAVQWIGPAASTTVSRLLRKEAQSYFTVHRYDDANRTLDEAESRLPPSSERSDVDWREWIELQQTRFWTLYYQRKTGPETMSHVAYMQPIVQQHGTALQRSITYRCAASDLAGRLRYRPSQEVLALNRAALAEIENVPGTALERAAARFAIGFALWRGSEAECREAATLLASVAEGADRMGDMTLLARSQTYRAVALRRLNDLAGTDRAATEAFAASEAAQLPPYMGAALACRAWVAWRSDDVGAMETGCREAVALWARSHHAFPFRWVADLLLLERLRVAEDFARAVAVVESLLAPDQQMLDEPVWSSLLSARRTHEDGTLAALDRALRRVFDGARQGRYL
jgi:eukaryotic-like serine/threonine-protein kinase